MFLQLQPQIYPWSFSGIYNKDSLYIDSVVLVLGWNGSYGDTNAPIKVNVKEIDPFSDFRVDSFYTIRDPGPSTTSLTWHKKFYSFQFKRFGKSIPGHNNWSTSDTTG